MSSDDRSHGSFVCSTMTWLTAEINEERGTVIPGEPPI